MKKLLSIMMLVLAMAIFVGCQEKKPDIPVSEIMTQIENGTEYTKDLGTRDLVAQGDVAENIKINPEDIEEGILRKPDMGMSPMEVIVIKAKDESKVTSIKSSLEEHIEQLKGSFGGYGADAVKLIEDNVLEVKGKYILFTVSPEAEKVWESFDNTLK